MLGIKSCLFQISIIKTGYFIITQDMIFYNIYNHMLNMFSFQILPNVYHV